MNSISSLGEYIDYVKSWTENVEVYIENRIDRIRSMTDSAMRTTSWDRESEMNPDVRHEVFVRNNRFLTEMLLDSKRESRNFQSGAASNYSFFYRGQYNEKWEILPSVFRPEYIDNESFLYHEIMVRCADEFNSESHLDILVKMQHYDCPTRLLDVTSNPLVALFFACKNYGCKVCDRAEKGKVFLIRILRDNMAYSDSDRVLMLSCLSRFDSNDKRELLFQVNEMIKEKTQKFKQKTGGSRQYASDVVEKLYHEICHEVPSFKREINPLDLLKPVVVQPKRMNNRILKQDGAFIINGLCDYAEEITFRLETMVDECLIIENKERILDELNNIGINEASLFPEVDKVAGYLKGRCVSV